MSSLLTSASTWNNEDSSPKKRQPTMRKTVKLRSETSNVGVLDDIESESDYFKKLSPSTIDEQQNLMQNRNERVNELLNKMTSSDDSSKPKLNEFKPLEPPSINIKKDMDDNTDTKKYNPIVNSASYLQAMNERRNTGQYNANNSQSHSLSNYQQSYEPPKQLVSKPYYANMGIGATTNNGMGDNKVMEKINYMIHLLEAQQNEKTNYITEEFILYLFLGVFMIFIVDSFSRSGKYVR